MTVRSILIFAAAVLLLGACASGSRTADNCYIRTVGDENEHHSLVCP